MPTTSLPTAPREATVLMYHALADDGRAAGQDPHYTLRSDRFAAQLAQIAAHGGGGCARDWLAGISATPVLLSFDDGHLSNASIAFPMLAERGLRADFFVNPGNVGKPGYASWAQLRTMADAGMSIQSHGYDHVHLTELDASELRSSLRAAKHAIEDGVGSAVTLLAPPGGRMPPRLDAIARDCGYRYVLSSRPGRLRDGARGVLPRMAVTAALDERRFLAWISGSRADIAREQLRYAALALAKRVLGDARYARLRAQALPAAGGRA